VPGRGLTLLPGCEGPVTDANGSGCPDLLVGIDLVAASEQSDRGFPIVILDDEGRDNRVVFEWFTTLLRRHL